MAAKQKLLSQNVVIVTQDVNTTMFNQYWFIHNGIFCPEEILADSIFVPGLTNLSTQECNLIITPNQFQFNVKSDDLTMSCECITKRLIRIIEKVSGAGIQMKAIGLNFIWKIFEENSDIHQFSKRLFYLPSSNLHQVFDVENARFGTYVSKDFLQSRLKLDIKPVISDGTGEPNEFILASFNFHRDLTIDNSEQSTTELLEQLKSWNLYYDESARLVCILQ